MKFNKEEYKNLIDEIIPKEMIWVYNNKKKDKKKEKKKYDPNGFISNYCEEY